MIVKAGFISLSLFLAVILLAGINVVARKAFPHGPQARALTIKASLLLAGWLTYITLVSFTGFFTATGLPPRIPLFLVLPAFVFFIYFFRNYNAKLLIANTPAHWPVYFQSFRIIVELLIWGSYLNGIIPREATFEGYNFDVLIGLSAIPMGFLLVYKGIRKIKQPLILWNIAGFITLAVVVFTLVSQAYFYSNWGLTESFVSKGFGTFPYTLLAGFLMPLAVFMHILSLFKIKK